MKKGQQTRERILSLAEAAVLVKGFGATSIDELIEEAGINDLFQLAHDLHDDPLHRFLIGLKLFADMMNDIPAGHPGCFVATICYQERPFERRIHELNQEAVMVWRRRFRQALDEIAEIYPPRDDVDLDDVADMVSTCVEGGIVMSKALKDPKILGNQLLLYRSYIELLFSPSVN